MQSNTINVYTSWIAAATEEQIAFVDAVYALCENHYEEGGDTVVETFHPREILMEFKSIKDVREYCGLRLEAASNARWGEDNDPEVKAVSKFEMNWPKELCDVCGSDSGSASICDKCCQKINSRIENDGTNPHDGDRITPDPEYVRFYQQNGYYPKW